MNWSHSGGMLKAIGFLWVVAAILVVADVSAEVWLACGIACAALIVVNAFTASAVAAHQQRHAGVRAAEPLKLSDSATRSTLPGWARAGSADARGRR